MSAEFSSGPENRALSDLIDLSMPATSEAIATVADAISETLAQLEVPELPEERRRIATKASRAAAKARTKKAAERKRRGQQ